MNDRPVASDLYNPNGRATCPGCGCVLFVNKKIALNTVTIRYENCRNPSCMKRYKTRQPNRVIVEEIKPKVDKDSSIGNMTLRMAAGLE